MAEIKAILLIPEKGDPLGLLADGVCGSRPPMALRWTDATWGACGSADVPQTPSCRMYDPGEALVLAWDGKSVREGCYRAADASGYAPSAVPGAVECALDGDQMIRSISELGTIILLDAEGQDIA
jgi:hypothetical protein